MTFSYRWHAFGVRKELYLRCWFDWYTCKSLPRWLLFGHAWYPRRRFFKDECTLTFKTLPGTQQTCYCPTGSVTNLEIRLLGFRLNSDLSRDWTKKPCWCDVVIWKLFREDHEEDIEDAGGMERLHELFPGLRNVA